jgi:hypothetical protein
MIFIFSSPRSGSTWLAKAFDSHPDTLYLHEPDIVDRGKDLLPYWFPDDVAGFEHHAQIYLDRLCTNRNLRTIGTRPFFRKSYRSEVGHSLRAGLIYFGKGVEKAGLRRVEKATIPDMVSAGRKPTTVIKSVSALGRMAAFLKSGTKISAIHLLRHPCAYVSSYVRGNRLGVMPPPPPMDRLLKTRSARLLNVDAELDKTGDPVERLAWEWLLANCEASEAIAQAGGFVVKYEDVAISPEKELRTLFSKLGLDWSDSTTQFLKASSSTGEGSYYSLTRDPMVAISRWKQEMPEAHIKTIKAIVTRDPVGQQYFS